MRRALVGLAILAGCASLVGCLHVPMPWSPDGSWIAFTVTVRPVDRIIAPGWTYAVEPGVVPATVAPAPLRYQLWTTRAAGDVSVLLEDSAGPLTAPGWSPDGHALAFGRVVTAADRSNRFEIVILEGSARRRVISSRPIGALDAEAADLPFQGIAWSPDGRYLAIPQLGPLGLVVLRADNGRIMNTIPDAFLPSWAPTGGRLAFYIRTAGHALHYVDSPLGQPRHLLEVGQASQAPLWSRDGGSIALVVRRPDAKLGAAGADVVDLVRVRLDTALVEPILSLSPNGGPHRDRPIEGASITCDRDGDNLFCSAPVEGRLNQVTWYHPRDNAIYKKFTIIDPALATGSLSLAPDGRTLAARPSATDHIMPPVLCEPEDLVGESRTRLVAPDDPARLEWIATLVRTASALLRDLRDGPSRPAAGRPSAPAGRPTILPLATELLSNPEIGFRLRHLGKLGQPLCERPTSAPELDPSTRQVFDEARLFFAYLADDYPAALNALATLDPAATTPERRLALLTVRAQVLLNQGQYDTARRVVALLEQIDPPDNRRVEATGDRYRLTVEPRAGRGWPKFLAESIVRLQTSPTKASRDEANDESNLRRNQIPFRQEERFRPDPFIRREGPDQPFAPRRAEPQGDFAPKFVVPR